MSTAPRPLARARTWAASTLLAGLVGTAALGYHLADVQSQTLASSTSAGSTSATTSGTSSTSSATGTSSGLGSTTGQAQASTHGS